MTLSINQNERLAKCKKLFAQYSQEGTETYLLDAHNQEVIDLVLLYVSQHPDFLKTKVIHHPSFNKGLAISGNPGSGKTHLLKIIGKILKFGVIECRELSEKCSIEGKKELSLYGRQSFKRGPNNIRDYKQPITRGFDDMGAEEIAVFYGNKIDTMGEIIQDRYSMFIKYKLMTHITTNLNGEEMEERYGSRVRSRMRQMFNQITLIGPDRRK